MAASRQLQIDSEVQGPRAGFPDSGPQTYERRFRPDPAPGVAVYSALSYPDDYLQTPPDDTDGWMQDWMDGAILRAIGMRASDMTLNTDAHKSYLTIDIRVDGTMRPMYRIEGQQAGRLMGHFKNNTNLHSTAAFKPEEAIRLVPLGHGETGKARVASFRKSDGGDSIVMRLPPTGRLKTLDQLSFSDNNLFLVRRLLESANQMVMLAGPMGSGKTTTAHGCLMELNSGKRTVWSIEDPVERTLPGVVQLEVNEENEAGFHELLPALVRADYDTLFLGEIRDNATAAAGVRQAKAGRQVLTTIHANDNVTALLRLIELAEDSPLAVLDSVRGVISQRLVARLNPDWREGMNPVDKYKGRVPVHEVLTVTPEIVEAMSDGSTTLSEVRGLSMDSGDLSTFQIDCERLINDGTTDEAEVYRVFGDLFNEDMTRQKPTMLDVNDRLAKAIEKMAGAGLDHRLESAVRTALAESGIQMPTVQPSTGRRAARVLDRDMSEWEAPEPEPTTVEAAQESAYAPQEAEQGIQAPLRQASSQESNQAHRQPVGGFDLNGHHIENEELVR